LINLFLALFISVSCFALPQHLEVWFVSHDKRAELLRLLDASPYIFRAATANLQCQEMGDFCFDPQYGLYKKEDTWADVDVAKMPTEKERGIPSAQSVDRDLITCDKNNFFDIFCGRARKGPVAETKLDLWIDTSGSMREFDFGDKGGGCFRKGLVTRLDKFCGFNQKMNVMMFDTSIKQAGTIDQLCTNQGLNDTKKLMDFIERSEAKKVVIVTDIYELHQDFITFIQKNNGKIKGYKETFTATQLLEQVSYLTQLCQ
jgi:hypothetical protein